MEDRLCAATDRYSLHRISFPVLLAPNRRQSGNKFHPKTRKQLVDNSGAPVTNESKVSYDFKRFTLKVSYTVAEDELQNTKIKDDAGRDIYISAEFPHIVVNGSWLDDAEHPDDRLEYGASEPGESDRWLFTVCIPLNATIVRVIVNCGMTTKRNGYRSSSLR